MAKLKTITVYPHERVRAVLGTKAALLNQALECWADLIARASADNARDFSAAEWCVIADVCNGTIWEPGISNPGALLAAEVSDGHSLDGTGYRWFCNETDELAGSLARMGNGQPTKGMKGADEAVRGLVGKLAALDYIHAWSVILAAQWFWANAELEIDPRSDPWWTLAFRQAKSGGGA